MNALRLNKLLRNASDPAYRKAVEKLRKRAQSAMEIRYVMTEQEQGNWSHYYYCPDDGTRLCFDWSSPGLHVCPVCAKEWCGEPYDGAWVTIAHALLGTGMKDLAVYSLIADDMEAVARVKEVLIAYARFYEGFEVHGEIPYNGPGKLFAQTLDESHWIIDLCYAYWLTKSRIGEAEKQRICSGLLRPCAEFLILHKELQLHNHALLITSAIGMLGFLLEDETIHRAGLEGPYGLLDQMNRGVLDDGMWYEGNFHYHFYGYHSLLQYCILLEGTVWDLKEHPVLKRMFDFPLNYLLPDGSLPNLNDSSYRMTLPSLAPYYEVAFAWYHDARYGELLQLAYGLRTESADEGPPVRTPYFAIDPVERDSMESLWFGEDLRAGKSTYLAQFMASDSTSDICGLSKLVNRSGWHLLVKHSTFGGEHDHMDRLGLSFGAGSVPLFVDPGTTSYAVPAHYGWFKHTFSHNTVCLNGKDQPPADGRLLQYHRMQWGAWMESAVDWHDDKFRMKGSIILPPEMCPWDKQAYRGANIRRINALTDRFLLDIVKVTVPEKRVIDLLYHMSGSLEDERGWEPYASPLSTLSQEWFYRKLSKRQEPEAVLSWRMKEGKLLQASWCSESVELITAQTPDNPLIGKRQSLIQRVHGVPGREVLFINVFAYKEGERDGRNHPESADFMQLRIRTGEEGRLLLSLGMADTDHTWTLEWRDEKAAFASQC